MEGSRDWCVKIISITVGNGISVVTLRCTNGQWEWDFYEFRELAHLARNLFSPWKPRRSTIANKNGTELYESIS